MPMPQPFSGKAAAYAKGRPDYPEALFDELYGKFGFSAASVLVDMGAGTGKFCRPLLARGSTVYAVEPNAEMLRAAVKLLGEPPRFHPVCASAESCTLPTGSVDHITCAAAFHWLDPETFRRECLRILRPGGLVVTVWNVRQKDAPLNLAHAEVFRAFCPDFESLTHGFDACQPALSRFYGGRFTRLLIEDSAVQDRETFLSRSLSSSYALRAGHAQYSAFVSALEALFDAWQHNGTVTVPAQTIAFVGAPSTVP